MNSVKEVPSVLDFTSISGLLFLHSLLKVYVIQQEKAGTERRKREVRETKTHYVHV